MVFEGSADMGRTWAYTPSPFPPISSGQRLALTRLREGPLFLASYARKELVTNAAGKRHAIKGLFAALSYDEGETWVPQETTCGYYPNLHEIQPGTLATIACGMGGRVLGLTSGDDIE